MDSIVAVMKKIAEHETQRVHTTELGIVTAVFPHAEDGDQDNYQCSVKLKNRKLPSGGNFELRKVPVATPYLGLVAIPNVGDLVLLSFIDGDINAPVIIGRLYNDEDRPPANKKDEYLLQHKINEGGSVLLDKDGKILLTSRNKKNVLTVEDEKVSVKTDKCTVVIDGGAVTFDNGSCKFKLEGGGLTLDVGSNPVKIKGGNVEVEGQIVKIDGTSIVLGGGTNGAVANLDTLTFSSHTHMGNLGAPCPILVPTETLISSQAASRKTKVG